MNQQKTTGEDSKMTNQTCVMCGKETAEYGKMNDKFYCYDCCAVLDTQQMKDTNQIVLYLDQDQENNYFVSNWPGTLKIMVEEIKKGKHNIAKTRYDVWFSYAGKNWHGVQYGEWTQLCHCKAVK